MIIEGLKLMVIGMIVVMLFLGLMVYCINFVAYLTRTFASRELEAIKKERDLLAQARQRTQKSVVANDPETDIAVITAAVAAYERDR